MSFITSVANITVTKLLGATVAVGSNILLARILSPVQFSSYVGVIAVVAIITRASVLGLGQAAQYFGARERTERIFYAWAVCICMAIVGIAVTVSLRLWIPQIGLWMFGEDLVALEIYSIVGWLVPLSAFSFVVSLYVLGRRDLLLYGFVTLCPVLVALSVLSWGLWTNAGLSWVIHSIVAQHVVGFVISGVCLIAVWIGNSDPRGPTFSCSKRMFQYGLRSFSVSLGAFIAGRVPLIVGPWFAGNHEMGIFAVSRVFSDALLLAYGPIGMMVFSYVGSMEDKSRILAFVERACRLSLVGFSLISLLIACFAPFGVELFFGPEYSKGHLVVWCLLPGLVLKAVQGTLENYLFGRGKQGLMVLGHLLFVSVFLGFASLLGSRYGSVGLALSASIGFLVSLLFTVYLCYRKDGLSPKGALIPGKEDLRFVVAFGLKILVRARLRFDA